MHAITALLLVVLTCSVPAAAAHTTVSVDKYEIEVGWNVEPPIVGIRNDFVITVTEPGEVEGVSTGVKNAFKSMDATVMFGGEKKSLGIGSESRPGHYFASVIPTRTGSYSVEFSGVINGIDVMINVPIEDVESTSVLDFPSSVGGSDQDITALKSSVSAMQQQIRDMSLNEKSNDNAGMTYDLAIFAISFGIAGVVLAVIAMIRKK